MLPAASMACLHIKGGSDFRIANWTIATHGFERFYHMFDHRGSVWCLHNDPPAHANSGLRSYRLKKLHSHYNNMRLTRGLLPIYIFCVQYRDISWHGNLICHLQASFILKNDTQEAVKKQFSILSHSNSGSVCLLGFIITCLGRFIVKNFELNVEKWVIKV